MLKSESNKRKVLDVLSRVLRFAKLEHKEPIADPAVGSKATESTYSITQKQAEWLHGVYASCAGITHCIEAQIEVTEGAYINTYIFGTSVNVVSIDNNTYFAVKIISKRS